jgi:hypothetical protein
MLISGLTIINIRGVNAGTESHSAEAWLNTVLLLIYAFTGFESALITKSRTIARRKYMI